MKIAPMTQTQFCSLDSAAPLAAKTRQLNRSTPWFIEKTRAPGPAGLQENREQMVGTRTGSSQQADRLKVSSKHVSVSVAVIMILK